MDLQKTCIRLRTTYTIMKKSTLILLIFIICSCSKDENIKRTFIVNISETQIQKTSVLADKIEIKAIAVESNGCWKDLHFVLTKENEFNYSLKAFGTFESNGACPTVMVFKDTIINFIPTLKGKYFFHINDKPYKVKTDTLIVD